MLGLHGGDPSDGPGALDLPHRSTICATARADALVEAGLGQVFQGKGSLGE